MALEAVLVLEVLLDLQAVALDAAVGAVGGDGGVAEQVQAAHRHLGERLGVLLVAGATAEAAAHARVSRAAGAGAAAGGCAGF